MVLEESPWSFDGGGGKGRSRPRRSSKEESPSRRIQAVDVTSIDMDEHTYPSTPPHSSSSRDTGKQGKSSGDSWRRSQSPRLEVREQCPCQKSHGAVVISCLLAPLGGRHFFHSLYWERFEWMMDRCAFACHSGLCLGMNMHYPYLHLSIAVSSPMPFSSVDSVLTHHDKHALL